MAAAAFVAPERRRRLLGCGFGDVVSEFAAPGSGEASWRIKEELGRSGLRVSFLGFFVCRSVPMAGSHGFFCALAAAGSCRSARMSVLRGGSGNCYGDGTGAAVRRLAYSCLEESGWRFSFGVSLLLVESPADLGAPVLLRLGDGFNGRSSIQACIDYFGVPIAAKDGYKKVDVASSEVSSSSWRLASSCVVAVLYFQRRSVGRRLRSPISRITGRVL